jgi:prevent-host-death family protein
MQSIITLTEAKAKFSELINRIIFKKETFVVTKKGRKVAVVIPVEKYRPEDSDGLIDARGALAELDESIDDMVGQIYAARRTERDRKVEL